MPSALYLLAQVALRLELGVRRDRAGLGQHLAALDVLALDATEQAARVVAGLALVERLVEHLDAGDDGLLGLRVDADDLALLADLDLALLDAAGDDRAAARDREHVLDRHQERPVDRALGVGDGAADGVHELDDPGAPLLFALERLERRDLHDGGVVARELVLREQLADLELDELHEIRAAYTVRLVEAARAG